MAGLKKVEYMDICLKKGKKKSRIYACKIKAGMVLWFWKFVVRGSGVGGKASGCVFRWRGGFFFRLQCHCINETQRDSKRQGEEKEECNYDE